MTTEQSLISPVTMTLDSASKPKMKKSTCDLCGKMFSRRDNMERHRIRHLRREVFKCETCGKDFSQKSYLKLHRRLHTGEKPFGCNLCGRAFSRNDHLVIHIRGHQGIKMFNCQICNKSYAHRSYLTVHQRIHTNTRPYKCHVCGCAFYRGDHLIRHCSKQHGETKVTATPTSVAVDIADINANINNNNDDDDDDDNNNNNADGCIGEAIVQHQMQSSELVTAAGQQVQIVSLQSTSEQELAEIQQVFKNSDITGNNSSNIITTSEGQLLATVGDVVDNTCNLIPVTQCITSGENALSNQDTMQPTEVYQLTNIDPEANVKSSVPYNCDICSKRFSRRDNLERHKSTHFNEKLFNCDVCQKSFSRKSYLRVHHRIHTGEKPYVCDRCGFAFSRKDHLLKHKKNNEGERKLSCVPPKQIIDLKEDIIDADGNCQQVVVISADPSSMIESDGTNMVITHATMDPSDETKTVTMYQTTANAPSNEISSQIYPIIPVFPTTIEISPSTAQIFPTIHMYPANTQCLINKT
ncbi:zinc finger protein 182-like [Argonauta hians]